MPKHTLDFGTAAFGLQAALTTLSKEDIVEGSLMAPARTRRKVGQTGSADYSFHQPLALLRVSVAHPRHHDRVRVFSKYLGG